VGHGGNQALHHIGVDRASIDASLACGVHDIEVVQDLVDILFRRVPASGCPCKALSPARTNERSTMARAIPVGVGIVNPNVCRLGR
jgi:hypothetical protein